MRATDRIGILGEELAAEHLESLGHTVLERRWRAPRGEIDLITSDGGTVVAVEVKTRRGLGFGHPFEAVTGEKLRRLHRLLLDYLAQDEALGVPRRVDVVAVLLDGTDDGAEPQIEHLKDVPR